MLDKEPLGLKVLALGINVQCKTSLCISSQDKSSKNMGKMEKMRKMRKMGKMGENLQNGEN